MAQVGYPVSNFLDISDRVNIDTNAYISPYTRHKVRHEDAMSANAQRRIVAVLANKAFLRIAQMSVVEYVCLERGYGF